MYATFATITVSPGMWALMAKGPDQMYAAIKNLKGFREAKFFGDDKLCIFNSLVGFHNKEASD